MIKIDFLFLCVRCSVSLVIKGNDTKMNEIVIQNDKNRNANHEPSVSFFIDDIKKLIKNE